MNNIVRAINKANHHYFQFEIFDQFPELVAFVTTRSCGDLRQQQNRELVLADWPKLPKRLTVVKQVHGITIHQVKNSMNGDSLPLADGLLTNQFGKALAILTADCAPIFMFDPQSMTICLLHAGWRGVQKKIIEHAVATLARDFGVEVESLLVGVGPLLGRKDYQVQQDLVEAFDSSHGQVARNFFTKAKEGVFFDLEKAILFDLMQSGIPENQIELSKTSTAQDLENFYSHRAEHGQTGRFGSVICLV